MRPRGITRISPRPRASVISSATAIIRPSARPTTTGPIASPRSRAAASSRPSGTACSTWDRESWREPGPIAATSSPTSTGASRSRRSMSSRAARCSGATSRWLPAHLVEVIVLDPEGTPLAGAQRQRPVVDLRLGLATRVGALHRIRARAAEIVLNERFAPGAECGCDGLDDRARETPDPVVAARGPEARRLGRGDTPDKGPGGSPAPALGDRHGPAGRPLRRAAGPVRLRATDDRDETGRRRDRAPAPARSPPTRMAASTSRGLYRACAIGSLSRTPRG